MYKMDADTNAFFLRELEHVYSRTYDIKYPELKARSLIPTSNEAPEGATSVTYQQYDAVGQAKIIGQNAKDVPRVDITGKEFPRPVRPVGASYGYTYFEIKAAQMAGKPLQARKASAARRTVEEKLDEVAALGAPEFGISNGFLNDAAVPSTPVGGGNDWATLIGAANTAAVIKQMTDAVQRIVAASNGVHMPDTIVIPDSNYALIATTPRSDTTDTTILDFVLGKFPMINSIVPWYRNADVGGDSVMVVYKRDAEILHQDIPMEFFQMPPEEQGFEYVVSTAATTAGSVFTYPLAADYSTGV